MQRNPHDGKRRPDLGRGARGTKRRRLRSRHLAVIVVLPVLGAMALGVSALGFGEDGRPLVTGFDLADGRTAHALTRLRHERDLALVVHGASCVDGHERTSQDRVERVEHRETRTAVTAAVRMRVKPPQGDPCVRVDLKTTLHLARPIGDRALITHAGPYQFRLILIPPTDRAAVRRLVVRTSRARKQPPAFMYFGPACDLVARDLADIPERDWCFY
jgi:hypothetical protein